MQAIKASNYSIYFQDEGYLVLQKYIENTQPSSIVILVDKNTQEYCLPRFLSLFSSISSEVQQHTLVIPAGEQYKTIATCSQLWNDFTKLHIDRKSLVINIGGGMLTDLGGFVASTYKRGIKFINVPTTLLSMVDASVGGKTGVDLGNLKNLVGLFANPEMVLIDTEYLETISKCELRSGMAEIIKYGLTYDKQLWEDVQQFHNLTIQQLNSIIHRSIEIKNEVVLQDPKEQNLRKILNFGHTVGHAVESYFLESEGKTTLTHGEAIAIGMVCECYISSQLLGFPKEITAQLKDFVLKTYGKVDISQSDFAPILELLKHDKKNVGKQVRFVLLNNLEDYKIDCEVPTKLVEESLAFYLR